MAVTLAIVIVIYLLILLVVALWANRRVQNEADYIIAGRRLPMWLGTATLFATWFGAGTLLTATDEIRMAGLSATALEPYGAGLCLVLAGALFARRLWSMELYTISDVFKVSFGERSEVLSVLITIPGYVGWLAIQLVALAGILNILLDIPMPVGVLLVAVVSLAYTLLGGMWSVTITDAIQMLFILAGVLWLGYVVFDTLGSGDLVAGVGVMADRAQPGALELIPTDTLARFVGWVTVLLVSMLGNLPSQELAQRIMASNSARTAQRACIAAGLLYIGLGTVPVLLGVAAQHLLPADQTSSVLQALALRFFSPAMIILFAVSIISVVMSTITSGLLAPATAIAHNLLRKYVPETVSSLALCRYCVVFVLVLSVIVALVGENAYDMLEASYATGLVGLFVPFAAGMYGLRASDRTALLSMGTGIAIWAVQFVVATALPLNLIAVAVATAVFFGARALERGGHGGPRGPGHGGHGGHGGEPSPAG